MEKYGRWEIIDVLEKTRSVTYVLAKCECGESHRVNFQNIKRVKSTRCNECRLKEKRTKIEPFKMYNNWRAIKYSHTTDKGRIFWIFRCKCNREYEREIYDVATGRSTQCSNCARKQNSTTHGFKGTRLYNIWVQMRNRCKNPKNSSYKNYGKLGIKVCERWDDFLNFKEDMGEPPTNKHTLDRINVTGNYCIENCRWATRGEQARNRRDTIFLTYKDQTLSLSKWADLLGHSYQAFFKRYQKWGDDVIEKSIKRIAKIAEDESELNHQ